ncbi:MAG: helix-turn-helix domain-containing protein [Magnetococcales bacterium]|nr:helix-turn-helix domain-containing protein [Magnetococcales bacterium]
MKPNDDAAHQQSAHLVEAESSFNAWLQDPECRKSFEETSLKIEIAQAIHAKRKALKMSQAKLAQKAQTTQRIISRIEHADMSVGVDLLQRIANALGTRVSLTFG